MNKLEILFETTLYGGLSRDELHMCSGEIKKRNVEMLEWVLPIMLVAVFLLFVLSLFPWSGEAPNKRLYGVYLALMIIEDGSYHLYFKKKPDVVLYLSYAFALTAYSFGIFEATMLGESASSTLFCVFLVAIPMMIIDLPIRLFLLMLLSEAMLLITYFVVGNKLGDPFVVVSTLSCTLIGISCGNRIQRTNFRAIRDHILVETQRDTDIMTGALSRIAFVHDMAIMSDDGISVGIVYCDVNCLKQTNDMFGHEAGDRLIRKAYQLMLRYFDGPMNKIYRIGGDEFVIISIGCDKDELFERFTDMSEKDEDALTISCGCVWLRRIKDTDSAIREAEDKMYQNKNYFYETHPDKDRRMNWQWQSCGADE